MESTTSTLGGLLCLAALCLIPLAAIAGGVVFFLKRKRAVPAAGEATPVPQQAAAARPAVQEAVAHPAAQPPVTLGMAAAQETAAMADLSPSEMVWLRGEVFAESAGMLNSEKILYNNATVKGPALAVNTLQAAVLALLQAGDARLEPGRRKAMMGLKETDTLYLVPSGKKAAWPTGSYEERLLAYAVALQPKNQHSIDTLVYAALEQDNSVPWMQVFVPLKRALAHRGILAASKAMMGLSLKFEMPPATAARVAGLDVAPLLQSLSSFAAVQPDTVRLLAKEINEGLGRRTTSD